MPSRRQFMKWTVTTAAALSGGVVGYQLLQKEDMSSLNADQYSFLSQEDCVLLLAICPVILGEGNIIHWQQQKVPLITLLNNLDQAIGHFSLHSQQELRELLDLLWSRLGKLMLAGVWLSWTESSATSIDQFLSDWRNSWLEPLNQGYAVLQQLTMAAFFSEQKSWSLCGYPGPPLQL